MIETMSKLRKVSKTLLQDNAREPTSEETAEAAKVSLDETRRVMRISPSHQPRPAGGRERRQLFRRIHRRRRHRQPGRLGHAGDAQGQDRHVPRPSPTASARSSNYGTAWAAGTPTRSRSAGRIFKVTRERVRQIEAKAVASCSIRSGQTAQGISGRLAANAVPLTSNRRSQATGGFFSPRLLQSGWGVLNGTGQQHKESADRRMENQRIMDWRNCTACFSRAGSQEEMERGPRQLKARQQAIAQKLADLETQRQKHKALRMSADQRSLQLKSNETKIGDLKVKLNQAASNREFDIIRAQMEADTVANSVLEDEILDALERSTPPAPSRAGNEVAQAKADESRFRRDSAALPGCQARGPGRRRLRMPNRLRKRGRPVPAAGPGARGRGPGGSRRIHVQFLLREPPPADGDAGSRRPGAVLQDLRPVAVHGRREVGGPRSRSQILPLPLGEGRGEGRASRQRALTLTPITHA